MLMNTAIADSKLTLEQGLQQSFQSTQPVGRVAVGDPTIADVSVITEYEILITPQQPGVTSLTIWSKNNSPKQMIQLTVTPAKQLKQHGLDKLEEPDLQLDEVGEQLQLQGEINSLDNHAVARSVLGFDTETGIDSTVFDQGSQVQIDIKIVELSKNRLQSAGFFFGKGNRTPRSISAPGSPSTLSRNTAGGLSLLGDNFALSNDTFNLIYGRASNGLLAAISVLEGNGFAYTLAEPSLVAMSGQSANFLAGGEFPVPVRGSGLDNSVTIEYKEFGVRLSLTPTVLDQQRIALKVSPEVSELDFNAGIQTGGVTVPALRVRRTDTTVALGDGESFVISGLISQNTLANVDKMPWLGDIPIIGAFFRSNQLDRSDRELLMIVTPHLVKPLARNAALPELPGEKYRNYNPDFADFLFFEKGDFVNRPPVSSGFSK
jgi:pilus assembly protein CpaC